MSKTVMLGDEQVRLGAFKTFKATEAIGLVGQIFATYPGLIDETRSYAQRNPDASEPEALAAVFPAAWTLARGTVLDLLALVATPDADLENADLDGMPIHRPPEGSEWATKEGYRRIVHHGEIQQLAAFVVAAYEVLKEQLRDADPQTRAAIDLIRARVPKITLSGSTHAESEPESSPTSAKPSPGRAKNSSTGSRGRTRSTSAENSGEPEKTPSTTP
jgi:hypothetical protein